MHEAYSDDYASLGDADSNRMIPQTVRRVASAVVFVALVGGMGIWAYRLGTRDASEVPIIRAMQGPTGIAPADPGGYQAAHQGNEINRVLEGRAAPAPRKPVALAEPPALTDEDAPQDELALTPPPDIPPGTEGVDAPLPNEATAEALIAPAPDMGGEALVPSNRIAELAAEAEKLAEAEGTETAVVAAPRPLNRPHNLPKLRAAPEKAAAAASTPKPATRTEMVQQAAARTPTPAAAPASAEVREISRVSPGTRLVQLGAYDSEAITRQAWRQLVAANSDLLSSKSLYVERATNNARVFYRLRVAGFQNTDQTRQLCEALRARGIACIPVTLQ